MLEYAAPSSELPIVRRADYPSPPDSQPSRKKNLQRNLPYVVNRMGITPKLSVKNPGRSYVSETSPGRRLLIPLISQGTWMRLCLASS